MSTTKKPSLVCLLVAISLASVSAVLYTPGLPQMTHAYGLSKGSIQFTVTVYLLGYAIGPLLYGPLTNRMGRKPVLLLGMAIGVVANILCILSARWLDYWLIVVGRLLLALGVSAGYSIVMTMIGDVFNHKEARKVMSWAMLFFAVGPGLAVLIGGILVQFLTWKSTMYGSLVWNVVVLALCGLLPETLKESKRIGFNVCEILTCYWEEMKQPITMICATLTGCSVAFIYIFSAEAPFVGINVIGLTPEAYGIWNVLPLVGTAVGSLISVRLTHHISVLSILRLGCLMHLIASVLMFGCFLIGWVTVTSLFVFQFIAYLGVAFISANAPAHALSHSLNKAVTASLIVLFNIGTCFIMVLIVNAVNSRGVLTMPILYLALLVPMILLLALLHRKR